MSDIAPGVDDVRRDRPGHASNALPTRWVCCQPSAVRISKDPVGVERREVAAVTALAPLFVLGNQCWFVRPLIAQTCARSPDSRNAR